MDVLSLVGLTLGLVAVLAGNAIEGGQLSGLANLPAAVIVIGGTVGAAMLQSPWPIFKRAFTRLQWVVRPPANDLRTTLTVLVEWAVTARREGLLGLETAAEREADPFIRKGLQMLVDGMEPAAMRSVLEVDIIAQEERDLQAAKVFEAMGGYAPTIGILGAVMGLIQVMGNLEDPGKLGEGIATAFVATLYGVGVANLLLLPLSNKLRAAIRSQSRQREMILDALTGIADGENPRTLEMKLEGYLV